MQQNSNHMPSALLVMCSMALSAVVQAQESVGSTGLETIVVTANKRDQIAGETNIGLSVRDAEQLRQAGVKTSDDLERVLPGLMLRPRSSRLFSGLTVRGISSNDFYGPSVAVYVDGVPQDHAVLSQLLLDVQRVELLKGPQGTLYGKAAHGGVLNIVSRPIGPEWRANVELGAGSDHNRIAAHVSGPILGDTLFAHASVARQQQDGDWRMASRGADELGGSQESAGKIGLNWLASDRLELSVQHQQNHLTSDREYYLPWQTYADGLVADSALASDIRRRSRSTSIKADYELSERWQLSSVSSINTRSHTRLIGAYATYFPGSQDSISHELRAVRTSDRSAGSVDAVVGLFSQDDDYTTQSSSHESSPSAALNMVSRSDGELRSRALFGELSWFVSSSVDLTVGLRAARDRSQIRFRRTANNPAMALSYDGDAAFSENTGKLAIGWSPDPAMRVFSILSQGYKPGGFNRTGVRAGTDLPFSPETSTNVEIGFKGNWYERRLSLNASIYQINIKGHQQFVGPVQNQVLRNIGDARSRGAEFELTVQASKDSSVTLAAQFNRSKLVRSDDPTNSVDRTGFDLTYAPRKSLTLAAKTTFRPGFVKGSLQPGIALRYTGAHYFDVDNRLREPGRLIVNLALDWAVTKRISARAYVDNVADKAYRTYGFEAGPSRLAQPGIGRQAGITLRYAI